MTELKMKMVAKTFLFNKDGKILVLYRSHTHPRYAHHPDLPGGEVEEGESYAEAISREIEEETGLCVDAKLIATKQVKQIHDELTHIVCETIIDAGEPTITLSWEHERFEWLTLNELLNAEQPSGVDDYYLNAVGYYRSLN